MENKISAFERMIDSAVRDLLTDCRPRSLFVPAEYMLSLGGKRIRPLLVLLAADLFGRIDEKILNAALAVEIFHNFSLVHDDLMDRADLRRGHQTVHKKWDENSAILSGDAMVIESYKYIARVPFKVLPSALRLFSDTAMDICKGQQYDLDFENRLDVTEEEYLEMIRLKTAVLIGCALKLGAMVAGAPDADADALYDFGIHIGLAFQLKDDLLDVYGDEKTFGKKIGGDILCNKKTFLLIKALKSSDEIQRKELEKWLHAEEYDAKKKIAFVKNLYDELNLKFFVENLIEKYYLASFDYLSAVGVPDERKRALITLSERMMFREK